LDCICCPNNPDAQTPNSAIDTIVSVVFTVTPVLPWNTDVLNALSRSDGSDCHKSALFIGSTGTDRRLKQGVKNRLAALVDFAGRESRGVALSFAIGKVCPVSRRVIFRKTAITGLNRRSVGVGRGADARRIRELPPPYAAA
jgi:hypothetical protein